MAFVCLLFVALHGLWAKPHLHTPLDDDSTCALCHHASPPFDDAAPVRFIPPSPLEIELPTASLPAGADLECLVRAPKQDPPARA